MDIALSLYPNAGIFLIGDFNRCPVSTVLGHFILKQIVKVPTRGNSTLDLILTNMSALCNPPESLPLLAKAITTQFCGLLTMVQQNMVALKWKLEGNNG